MFAIKVRLLGLEKVFVSCNGPEKNRVGILVKSRLFDFLFKDVFRLWFNATFMLIGSLKGRKNFGLGIF